MLKFHIIKYMSRQIANRIMPRDNKCGWRSLFELYMVQKNGTDRIEVRIQERTETMAYMNYNVDIECRSLIELMVGCF